MYLIGLLMDYWSDSRCLSIIDVTGLLQFLDLDGSHGGGLDESQMHSGAGREGDFFFIFFFLFYFIFLILIFYFHHSIKVNWSVSNEKMFGIWNGLLTIQIFLLWWRKPECTFLDIWNPRNLSSVLDTSVFSRIWRSSKFYRLSIEL